MRRFPLLLPAFAALALAAPAPAQRSDTLRLPRFAVTPYLGGRIPFGTEQTFLGPDSTTGVFLDEERGGGALAGIDAELRVFRAFSAVAGLAYSTAGDVVFTAVELGDGQADAERFTRAGSTFLLAKAGLAYRIPLPKPDTRRFRSLGSLVVAPALVRETPANQSAINHFAVNLGYKAVLPMGSPRAAFQFGLEDYITFWNTAEYERRGSAGIDQPGLSVDFGSPRGNLFVFRGGFTLAFGGRAPEPALPYVPAAPVPEPVRSGMTPVRLCVVDAGELRELDGSVNAATGDTLVGERRFGAAYPATTGYAAGEEFFMRSEPITLNRVSYVKFGLTRVVPANLLVRAGEYGGIPVFRERNATGTPGVLYVPVRTGCEFQTYRPEQAIRGVRG